MLPLLVARHRLQRARSAAAAAAGPAEDLITTESLTEHVKVLASDEFEGRAPATPGGQKTQDYLAKQLSALGVEPGAPDGTYFQQVPIVESAVERNFVLSVPGNTYRYFDRRRRVLRRREARACRCRARWCSSATASTRRS